MEYLLSLKEEDNPDTSYNMDGLCRHYAKWNKPSEKDKYHMITLMRYLE